MAVSDPKSDRYGQHYTREEMAALVGPNDKEVEAVSNWLIEGGASGLHFSYAREYCHFSMSVEKVLILFLFYFFIFFFIFFFFFFFSFFFSFFLSSFSHSLPTNNRLNNCCPPS